MITDPGGSLFCATASVGGLVRGDGGTASYQASKHAQQVFDQIAAGNHYLLTDNVRPYVDHNQPFGALVLIQERAMNIQQLTLDNSDAWQPGPYGGATSILKGPMFAKLRAKQEARLAQAQKNAKKSD